MECRFVTFPVCQTALSGVVSSVARFEWVRGWAEEEVESQPEWLRWLTGWNWRTCHTIARGGGLECSSMSGSRAVSGTMRHARQRHKEATSRS